MDKPKLLDFYSGEGGAGRGYDAAGFEVYSLDRTMMRRNPFPFLHWGAIDTLKRLNAGERFLFSNGVELGADDFAAYHGSPPCNLYSITNHNGREYPDLVGPTRELFIESGKPWIIENVPRAPLIDPVTLCWTMFNDNGSVTDEDGTPLTMYRHRLFEANFTITPPGACNHVSGEQVAGAYGGARRDKIEARTIRKGGYVPKSLDVLSELMGVESMSEKGIFQAIPPAYTEWLGRQMMEHING